MSGGSGGGSAPGLGLGLGTLFFKMRTPRVIRTEFLLTIRVRFISSMRKNTNNCTDYLLTAITVFLDVSEFFIEAKNISEFFFVISLSARYPLPRGIRGG